MSAFVAIRQILNPGEIFLVNFDFMLFNICISQSSQEFAHH